MIFLKRMTVLNLAFIIEISEKMVRGLLKGFSSISLNLRFQGQTESKRSTKVKGPETKGTAMLFGFKKKSLPVYTGTTKKIPAGVKSDHVSDDNGNGGESDFYVFTRFDSIFVTFLVQSSRCAKNSFSFVCDRVNGFSAR